MNTIKNNRSSKWNTNSKKTNSKKMKISKLRKWIYVLFTVVSIIFGGFILGIYLYSGNIARNLEAVSPKTLAFDLTSTFYDNNGNIIADRYKTENRTWATFDELPKNFIDAVVATEDRNFWNHNGIDPIGIIRALFSNFKAGNIKEGASTLTQQLAKNILINESDRTAKLMSRKIKEALIAFKLEEIMSKKDIITYYVNVINYGEFSYGIKAAAKTYFNKELSELTLEESAVLAGIGLYQILKYRNDIKIAHLISKSAPGKLYREVVGVFQGIAEERLEALDSEQVVKDSDIIFTALPHGQSMELALEVKKQGKKLVDLCADFRLKEQTIYIKWYKVEHVASELLSEAVYSIPELHRGKIKKDTWLIANPGCYPTSIQLSLAPLLEAGMIEEDSIIADAKSGVSGSGRAPKLITNFCEENGNLLAYSTGKHRHKPEMENYLTPFGNKPVKILFSPHLVPMTRGIFSTIYCQLKNNALKEDDIRDVLIKRYQNEAFIKILDKGVSPTTKSVFGTNLCHINVILDEDTGTLVVLSVIDNLVKGASGQAIQNMNILFGLEETKGLLIAPVFP